MARFYYDTILHSAAALEFLIGQIGADRIALGSDYPFDMGMPDCARFVRSLKIPEEQRREILSGVPRNLVGGPAAPPGDGLQKHVGQFGD